MSASLVGSEMCIRDSVLPACKQQAVARRALPWNLPHGQRNARQERPVSYTHLTLPTICSV
eukprot:571862-Alexandrium_andersonii.AAC.1